MKEFVSSLVKELKIGLRPFSNRPRNAEGLSEAFNLEPKDEGLRAHQTVVSMNEDRDWGEEELYTPSVETRDIILVVRNFTDLVEVEGASVYVDGVLAGIADENGEVALVDVAVGGHSIKVTATGFVNSDEDVLPNNYFTVV